MIAGSFDQIGTKSARDHDVAPGRVTDPRFSAWPSGRHLSGCLMFPLRLRDELRTLLECRYRIWVVGKSIWFLSWLRRTGVRLDRRRVRDDGHAQDQPVTRVFPRGEP